MGQTIFGIFLVLSISGAALAESLPIAPRRQDDVDQVPKVIFSSTSGVDPAEGFDAVGGSQSQAAASKTADTTKVDEKVQKLKETPADGQKKSTKSAAKKSANSHRKPATAKGAPKKKTSRK